MATYTVKNIPDELYERLKVSAKANHRSINSEIIACIEQSVKARPINVEEFLERARNMRERTASFQLTAEQFKAAKEEGRP
jgi:plasmid stability protein